MSNKARDFIDFWIENTVHAAEEYGQRGGEQGASALTWRCIEMAKSQGLEEADLVAEVGDIETYIQDKLGTANQAERDRRNRKPT